MTTASQDTPPGAELRLPRIETERLTLRLGEESDADAVLEFFDRNREHLAPFDPVTPDGFYGREHWLRQLASNREDYLSDRSVRTFLFPREAPGRVVGSANLNNIIRGCFHSCFVGFSLDGEEQGKGLMREALQGLIRFAFEEKNLHRLSANYLPHNRRSGGLLKRLGFVAEGYARDYLFIAGKWEDHILTSLLSSTWKLATPGKPR